MATFKDTQADLILHSTNILTLDRKLPSAEMVAVRNDRIIGVGFNNDITSFKGRRTETINCRGLTVVPGFNDAHCHPISFALSLVYVDCSPAKVNCIGDIIEQIRRIADTVPEGRWIRASGYSELELAEKRHPSRRDLDKASTANPIILIKDTGKTCVLNSLALKMTGITAQTPDPNAGNIDRDPKTGIPTGVLSGLIREVKERVPPLKQEEMLHGIKLADRFYLANGITSIQDVTWSNSLYLWEYYKKLTRDGVLSPRVALMPGCDSIDEFRQAGLSTSSGDHLLKISGVKIALDESTGCVHPPGQELNRHALKAHRAGFQVALHVSDAYDLETALKALRFVQKNDPAPLNRPRLEHCAVCPPDLMQDMSSMKAIVVTQPYFLHTMGEQFLNDVETVQQSWLFPLRSLTKNNVKTAISSDSPLLPASPLKGIHAAVARTDSCGRTIAPEESVSVREALSMYTSIPAFSTYDEEFKGTITPGKLADVAILSDDPTKLDPDKLMDIKVVKTIIGGKIVWESQALPRK
jgi:predicted amidohydrolase YtcJ